MKKFLLMFAVMFGLVGCATLDDKPKELPECGAVVKANWAGEGWVFLTSRATGPQSLGFVFKKGETVRMVVLAVKDSADAKALAAHPAFQAQKAIECKYDDGRFQSEVYLGEVGPDHTEQTAK